MQLVARKSIIVLFACASKYIAWSILGFKQTCQEGAIPVLLPAEYTAWAGLLYVHANLVRQLDAELQARHQLPLSNYEVLLFLVLAPNRQMRMSELAQSIVLSLSGLSRLVDRLERDGYVVRQQAEEDRRGNYVHLTSQGYERWQAAHATHLAGIRRLFVDRLDAAALELLGNYWERILPGTHAAIEINRKR